MQPFSNKELYIMNGGNKLYIYKDGFGDVYSATPAEEDEWAKEIIAKALVTVNTEENRSALEFAIGNLVYHKYEGLKTLLLKCISNTGPARQIVFASALWTMTHYEKAFEIIFQIPLQHKAECLSDVFMGLNNFKNHEAARHFLINCLEGNDDELYQKAQRTISTWAWSGMPALRENNLLEMLQIENKNAATFKPAMENLKKIFQI